MSEGGATHPRVSGEKVYEWTTLHVANVPVDTARPQLEAVFSDAGPIKKCFVVKGREGSKSTIGFVTFASAEDCKAALKLPPLTLGQHTLKLKLAPNKKVIKAIKKDAAEEEPAAKADAAAAPKHGGKGRKARLVVRNLSFKATEKSMQGHFAKFGELEEINILKKPDGKMVGCAFIQYKNPNHAAKAIADTNAKNFLGRPIAVDWAVPKELFKGTKEEVKEEEVKEEELKEEEIKEEPLEIDEVEPEVKKKKKKREEPVVKKKEEDDDEDDDDEDDDDDDEDDVNGFKKRLGPDGNPIKPDKFATGHDCDENKTVFIKNLAYETDEEDLRDMMEECFGPVFFAKLVLDKIMQHPRGTAFVKFKSAEDAQKCVEISEGKDGIFLDKRQLYVTLAIKQENVKVQQAERKKKEAKDGRNLFLAREGMIREGTQAAAGVSVADLDKRKQVDKYKKNILKNLNMFVSNVRLCVRNLPAQYDDKKLRKLCVTNAPQGAKLKEAKVIRDMKQMENGLGVSKEYGFVTFTQHEDAIGCLRNLNNNPEIFGSERRPIVDFSVENRVAVQAREKREERSKQNNPNYKPQDKTDTAKPTKKNATEGPVEKADFSGAISDPKVKTLPKHSGAKIRHDKPKITRKDLKKKEQERKNPKKRKQPRPEQENTESEQQPEKKKKKKSPKVEKITKAERKDEKENKAFESMVNQYKNKFASNQQVLKKWFDT